MFRNQYDNDVTVWSPQGRIHQIEYAMEAVKQGSATVGLKSDTHAVLVALKRAQSSLVSHQKKMEKVAPHVLMSISGLTSDARSLGRYMRSECLSHDFLYTNKLPVKRLVNNIGDKLQIPTQRYGRRPFGVGIIIAGCDEQGPHIFQTCPSANVYDCKAMALGARSQSAKTYLERNVNTIGTSTPQGLIRHGLLALRETLPSEQKLTTENTSIGIVGPNQNAVIYNIADVGAFLEVLDKTNILTTVSQGDISMPMVSRGAVSDDDDDEEEELPMET